MIPHSTENPIDLFAEWYRDARETELKYPDAMTLATVDAQGQPQARIVLLKGFGENGFVFYTNFESEKGRELMAHPKAALCFFWKTINKQVRIRGIVEEVSKEEADAYFESRPRESRIGAWASNQSRQITGREELLARFEEFKSKFEGQPVPRPPHWSGFRLKPNAVEFWREGDYRLHDRLLFTKREEGGWREQVLSP